jgi:hypothetical protein
LSGRPLTRVSPLGQQQLLWRWTTPQYAMGSRAWMIDFDPNPCTLTTLPAAMHNLRCLLHHTRTKRACIRWLWCHDKQRARGGRVDGVAATESRRDTK